jgi:hypothetical protein
MDGFTNPDSATRKRSAYILGTVDEVAALDRLIRQYPAESDVDAKQAIQWAGRRLKAIRNTGYTTLDAMFAHYKLHAAPSQQPERAEQQVIEDYTLHTHMNTLDAEKRGAATNAALNVLLLPPMFSAGRFLSGSFSGADIGTKLDAMEHGAGEVFASATPPPHPGTESIAPAIQRLRAAANSRQRIDIVLDLAQTYNNPDALPHLAALFVRDEEEHVQEMAQRAAKLIYWNALYWDMKADGSIDRELEQRTASNQKDASAPSPQSEQMPPAASAPDIAEILRKAEEARKRRKRGR